jgi:hypothetical protein
MPAPRHRAPVYAALVPAAHRPTHRIAIWRGPAAKPVTLDVYRDGDVLRTEAGEAVVTHEAVRACDPLSGRRWHWTGADRSVTAFEVRARAGAPTTGGKRVAVRVPGYRGSLWLSPERQAAWTTAAAGKGGISEWLRELLEQRPLRGSAKMVDHLRRVGDAAAGLPEE